MFSTLAPFLSFLNTKRLKYCNEQQLNISEPINKEIIKDAMMIDEADNLQECLIRDNIENNIPKKCVECKGASTHETSLLKHTMSSVTFQNHLIE